MNNSQNVSIVIPTFNRAKMLKRAVDSALSQTVECEVIVCDHGSTDETPEFIKTYGNKIKYIRREVDHGPFFCWLDGVINAKHDLIHINFDDDWISPTFIEETLSVMNHECAFAITAISVHHENGTIDNFYLDFLQSGIYLTRIIEKHLLNSELTTSPGCALFHKKDIISALNIGQLPLQKNYYHGVGPDLLMFLMPLLKYKKFGFINKTLSHFDAHDDSITINSFKNINTKKKIIDSYEDVKKYYLMIKISQMFQIHQKIYKYLKLKKHLTHKFKRILKIIIS